MNVTHRSELEADVLSNGYEHLMMLSELGTSMLLKEFKMTKRYEPYMITGCRFYEYDGEYMFEHAQIKEPLKVELKTIKAEHNDYYYDFNCHQSSRQDQTATYEFMAFKNSIKLI